MIGRDDPAAGWAASSTLGAHPWYATVTPEGRLLQGGNVFDLCRRAGLAWEWDRAALHHLALIGYTLGTRTLHRRILRLPSGCRLTLEDGEARFAFPDPPAAWRWDEDPPEASFAALRAAFRDCLEGGGGAAPRLSLSAGCDSRLLLALCRAEGVRPRLSVMGPEEATDVRVAAALAKAAGLPLEQVALAPEDYLEQGAAISRVTSGVKTAADWHTYLYARAVADGGLHLVGSNGEFARSYYADAVARSPLLRPFGKRGLLLHLLAKGLYRARRAGRGNPLAAPRHALTVAGAAGLRWATYPPDVRQALDVFYATERVRHFIGAGLACYAAFAQPRSPFLDGRWIKAAAAIRRRDKQGARYPRAAIEALAPELAEIPFNRDPEGGPIRGYAPFAAVAALPRTRELLLDGGPLDALVSRPAREAMLAEGPARQQAVSLLLTLHFAAVNAEGVGGQSGAG